MTTIYNNLLGFLMDHSFLLLTVGFCLGSLGLIFKLVIKRKSYQQLLKLIQNDFQQGIAKLDQLEDEHLKKKVITDGKHQLNNRIYQQVKNHLIETGMLKKLLKKVKNGSKQERLDACQLLDEFSTPEALDYCTIALYDDSREVKKLALEVLVDHATPKIIATLIDYYDYCENQNDQEMKSKLSKVFLTLGNQALYQLLEAALTRDEKYKCWLINLFSQMELSETEKRKIGKVLLELLDDKLARVRKLAVRHLTDFISNEEAINNLFAKLNDSSPQVKKEALEVLGELDLPAEEVGPEILRLLTDNNQQVRISACNALFDLGDIGIDYLLRATQEEEAKDTIIQFLDSLDTAHLVSTIKKLYIDNGESNLTSESSLNNQNEKCG